MVIFVPYHGTIRPVSWYHSSRIVVPFVPYRGTIRPVSWYHSSRIVVPFVLYRGTIRPKISIFSLPRSSTISLDSSTLVATPPPPLLPLLFFIHSSPAQPDLAHNKNAQFSCGPSLVHFWRMVYIPKINGVFSLPHQNGSYY